jgi:hypothetical protein
VRLRLRHHVHIQRLGRKSDLTNVRIRFVRPGRRATWRPPRGRRTARRRGS